MEVVNKATAYIVSNIEDVENLYDKAIAAYALQLADHPTKDQVLDDFFSKSKVEGEFMLAIAQQYSY